MRKLTSFLGRGSNQDWRERDSSEEPGSLLLGEHTFLSNYQAVDDREIVTLRRKQAQEIAEQKLIQEQKINDM
jgi:hypothetical protein